MVSQNGVGKHYRGFEMEVKSTSFTFCSFLPLPNLKHEKENKVKPVIFLFSFFSPSKTTTWYRQEATAKSCSPSILYHLKKLCGSDHKATGKSSLGRAIYLQG